MTKKNLVTKKPSDIRITVKRANGTPRVYNNPKNLYRAIKRCRVGERLTITVVDWNHPNRRS